MEQFDTRGGGRFICDFIQKLPGEASSPEDGLLYGLTWSPKSYGCTRWRVKYEHYSVEARWLGAAAPGKYLVSNVTGGKSIYLCNAETTHCCLRINQSINDTVNLFNPASMAHVKRWQTCQIVLLLEDVYTKSVTADDDYCTSNPCMNGAECRSISGGFTCNPCPLNFTGVRCEFGTSSVYSSVNIICENLELSYYTYWLFI